MKINKKKLISWIPRIVVLVVMLVLINTQLYQSQIIDTLEYGFVFALLALGIFISYRILDIPDLSVDGTFALGVSVSAIVASNGHPILGMLLGLVSGALAGCVTGVLITKFKVQPILGGIITMTALYSINLAILGAPNLSLWKSPTIFKLTESVFGEYNQLIMTFIVLAVVFLLMFWFLKTQIGMSLRATGDNEFMVRASSINSDTMKILGFAIANALVSLSGAMYAQYTQTGDTNSGTGMLVVGLASIIIGEIFFSQHTILSGLLAAVFGAVAYRYILSFAMSLGIDTMYTKLLSAIIVAIAIALPVIKKGVLNAFSRIKERGGKSA
ncbi:MAG: ABC transporter permease [Ruminococcus sp.]|nr:ABC transporter permease [Ruminococcus sp.]